MRMLVSESELFTLPFFRGDNREANPDDIFALIKLRLIKATFMVNRRERGARNVLDFLAGAHAVTRRQEQ